ncbi:MAG: hypothetical protein O8C63_03020 [Candidatus Methanoperedens sp.]|nr:hypothetical protein [Candidatus Methanoperedens sp.]
MRTEIKVAIIGATALIIAAFITGIFQLPSNDKSTDTINSGFSQNSIIGGGSGNTFILNNAPDTATKDAITVLEGKLNQTEENITLTKEQVRLLAQALKDLDEKTSGIEKLPDGRTKIGSIISGTPSIVIQEHNIAASYFDSGNYSAALVHSQKAILAYEDSKQEEATANFFSGQLTPEAIGKLYLLGAASASYLGDGDLAYQYAKKALDADPSPLNYRNLAGALRTLGNITGALEYIDKAIQGDPTNIEYKGFKEEIISKQLSGKNNTP